MSDARPVALATRPDAHNRRISSTHSRLITSTHPLRIGRAAARSSGITSFITLRLLRKRLTTVAVGRGCRRLLPGSRPWNQRRPLATQAEHHPAARSKEPTQEPAAADVPSRVPATRNRRGSMPHQAMASTRRHATGTPVRGCWLDPNGQRVVPLHGEPNGEPTTADTRPRQATVSDRRRWSTAH
jgi:hypothetical protein